MVRDAVAFYNALIDSEEEDFLENDVFAVSLMNFIDRTIGSGSMGVGEDIEADIVELLFGIAAKNQIAARNSACLVHNGIQRCPWPSGEPES